MTTTDTKVTPRIYVASLADYNEGTLHGRWIDATLGADHIAEETKAMLERSPFARSDFARKWGMKAEEWAIHDYEGFGGLKISEWEQFDTVAAMAQLIEEWGEPAIAWLGIADDPHEDMLEESFLEAWAGEWDSPADFAAEFLEDIGQLAEVPEWLVSYIDFESLARDYELSGDMTFLAAKDGGVYAFRNY